MNQHAFKIPETCPTCGGTTEEEGSFLFCRSVSCPEKLSGSIRVWVSRLGLLNWGDALIDALTNPEDPKVSSVADLYRLSVEDIAMCSSGMKFASKCHDILHSNKSIRLELLLSAVNIPNFGLSTATDIVNAGFDTLEKVLGMSEDDLRKVPNVGPITASSVYVGLLDKKNLLIDLSTVLDIAKPSSGPLSKKSFCITGSTSVPRKALQKRILDCGGVVKESVGSGLDFLVTNEDLTTFSSSKVKKAKGFGTSIISESELVSMMGSLV